MITRYEDTIPDFSAGKKDYPETRLHLAVVDYLNGEIRQGRNVIKVQAPFPGIMFTAPTGEKKDESEAFWAKRKGYMPGTPDLLFWFERTEHHLDNPQSTFGHGAIELKAEKGFQSSAQKNWMQGFLSLGGKYGLCRKVSEVRDTLESWGLVCRNRQCIEPKLSQAEMMSRMWEAQKP